MAFRPQGGRWTRFLRLPTLAQTARTSVVTLQVACTVHLINEHVFEIRNSTGASMLPTLAIEGDFLLQLRLPFFSLLNSLSRAGSNDTDASSTHPYHRASRIGGSSFSKHDQAQGTGLQVGDLVVALSPFDPSRTVCKRVIGLPGDTVCLDPRMRPLPEHAWRGRSKTPAKAQRQEQALGTRVKFQDVLARSDTEAAADQEPEKELGTRMVRFEDLLAEVGVVTGKQGRGEVDVFASMDTDAPRKGPGEADTEAHNTAALRDLEQSYVRARGDVQYVTVPLGHVWLAGDNMSNSTDSRHYGPVPLGMVRGKVLARVYPNPQWLHNKLTLVD